MKNLKSFKGQSKLKKAAMNIMIKMSDKKKFEKLVEDFRSIDTDGSGTLSVDELNKALKNQPELFGVHQSDEDIQKIIDEVDYLGNGEINYTEFIAATMDQ